MRYFVLFFFFISTNNIYASSISIGGSHGVDVSSKSTEFEFDLKYIADSKFHEHDIEFDYDK